MASTTGATAHPSYRPDIDGLRAVAVLSVVGFHSAPTWCRGGFVGVDVFFVISGFLISTIIFQNIRVGAFSYLDFYTRRIRRIFPALLVVLIACLAFACYEMFTTELVALAKQVVAGAAFVANIAMWRETGYFNTASALKPLLHLWSLGVEEQYYIVWPLLVAALYRRTHRILAIVVTLLLGSFAVNVALVDGHAAASFYLPFSRFWELMVGSLLAHMALQTPARPLPDWLRESLAAAGLALIAASIMLLHQDLHFPGWWALAPTIGTLFVILAGPAAWLNQRVLASRPLVFCGLISYPLYLWHWPLLSFLRIHQGSEPSRPLVAAAVVASLLLAWSTYRWIERPLRFGGNPRRATTFLAVAMLGTAGVASALTMVTPQRPRDRYVAYFEPTLDYVYKAGIDKRFRTECNFVDLSNSARDSIDPRCYTPSTGARRVLLWGDSHAQHLSFGLLAALPGDVELLQVATSRCRPTIRPDTSPEPACRRSNALALQQVAQTHPDLVILAQFAQHERTDWDEIAAKLRRLGAGSVLLVGPVPHWTTPLPEVIARHYWPDPPASITEHQSGDRFVTERVLRERYGSDASLTYVSLLDGLCSEAGCLALVGPDPLTDLIVFDKSHFTANGSTYVAREILKPAMMALLARSAAPGGHTAQAEIGGAKRH